MMTRALAAGVLLAGFVSAAFAPTLEAADLYDDRPRYGSPYDDPRYRDIYGHRAPKPTYVERRDLPPPVEPYRDRRGYLAPMPPPAYVDRRHWQRDREPDCVPRHEVRRALQEDGWSGFHDLDVRGADAVVYAYRPSGHLYRLTVARCTGEVLSTHLVDRDDRAVPPPSRRYEPEPYEAPRSTRWDGSTREYDRRIYRY